MMGDLDWRIRLALRLGVLFLVVVLAVALLAGVILGRAL